MNALDRITHEFARAQMHATERLACAFSAQHGGMEMVSRRDERGRSCQYPTKLDHVVDIDSVPGLREERDQLTKEYWAATDIAPSKCMVVSWVDSQLRVCVSYELRPEGWR